MDNKSIIEKMIDCHRAYRKSYIEDLDSNNKYEILKLLLNKAINDSNGTYNVEKDIIKFQKVLDINNSFELANYDGIDIRLKKMWESSLYVLLNCDTSDCDTSQYIEFYLARYKELLDAGVISDKNRDKLEFDKLKIKLMNKKRR